MITVTKKQYLWLQQHGDRDEEDVGEDEKGRFILLFNGFGDYNKKYIPEDDNIDLLKRVYSSNVAREFVEVNENKKTTSKKFIG